jgi:multiple sugar transport system substrate-binding protein
MAGGGAALAACAPKTVVVKETVKETVIVEGTPQVVEKVVTATLPPVEEIELRMLWRIMGQNEESSMNAMFDAFEEEHPNMKITPRVFAPYPEVSNKAKAWIASGEPPAVWSPIAAGVIRYYVVRDTAVEIGPYMEADGYDTSDFYDPTLTLCQHRGKWYGLPALNGPTLMYYNMDLFDEAGLDYPPMDWDDKSWNWDTWLEYAQKLSKLDDDGNPTQYAMQNIGDTRYALRHWGLEWWNKEVLDTGYPVEFLPEREAVIKTLQFWQDLMYEYKYVPTPGETQAMQAVTPNLFLTGKIAMQMGAPGNFTSNLDVTEFDWSVATIPWPVDRPRWNYMYPDQWFIILPQPNQDASWELLKFVASPKGGQFYPIDALGWVAPRKSLEGYYRDYIMNAPSERHEATRDEVDVILAANELCESAWGHPTVEYEALQNEGLKPSWDLLLANEIDAEECVNMMEAAVMPIIEETTPDWVER